MQRDLPPFPNLQAQRSLAKTLHHAVARGDTEAHERVRDVHPRFAAEADFSDFKLTDAQLVIAREYGFASWPELRRAIESRTAALLTPERKAQALLEDPFLVTHPHPAEDPVRARALWRTIRAAMAGDRAAVLTELDQDPTLVNAEFFYASSLVFAAKEGHTDLAMALLERGANPSCVGWWGEEPIVKMAEDRGHADTALTIRRAIEAGHAPDEADAIISLIETGDRAALATRLADDPGVAMLRDRQGTAGLHKAIELGDADAVELLLRAGADVNEPDGRYSMRPIDWAIWKPSFSRVDRWDLVDRLVQAGANATVEIMAARQDDNRVREMVAQDPETVNFESPFGMTPKAAVAQNNDPELLAWLLANGADATRLEGPWAYALWIAVANNDLTIAELLLRNGADPNRYGLESSGTPAWLAEYTGKPGGRDPAMVELLTRYGGDDHSQTKTEYVIARHQSNPDDPRLSEEYVWLKDDGDLFATLRRLDVPMPRVITLCQTYLWRSYDTLRRLLEEGLDPNLPNYLRMTPLHAVAAPRHNFTFANPIADEEGSAEKARLLVEYGADIDAVELYHDATPLGWAAKFGSVVMAKCLLELGADPTRAGAPWAQPLEFAKRADDDAMVDVIEAALR